MTRGRTVGRFVGLGLTVSALGLAPFDARASTGDLIMARADSDVPLAGIWRCRQGDDPSSADRDIDDTTWLDVQLPAIQNGLGAPILPDTEPFWCRRIIWRPAVDDAPPMLLEVPRVFGAAEWYLNGTPLGSFGDVSRRRDADPYTAHRLRVAPEVWRLGEENALSVRLRRSANRVSPIGGPLRLVPASSAALSLADWARHSGLLAFGGALFVLGLMRWIINLLTLRPVGERWLATFALVVGFAALFRGMGSSVVLWPAMTLIRISTGAVILASVVLISYFEHKLGELPRRLRMMGSTLMGVPLLGLGLIPDEHFATYVTAAGFVMVAISVVGLGYFGWRRWSSEPVRLVIPLMCVAAFSTALVVDFVRFDDVTLLTTLWTLIALTVSFITPRVIGDAMRADRCGVRLRLADRQLHAATRVLTAFHDVGRDSRGDPLPATFGGEVPKAPPDRWAAEWVAETARLLEVRRVSLHLHLAETLGSLTLVAGVGLPEECRREQTPLEFGVAGWVYRNKLPLTTRSWAALPSDQAPTLEGSPYVGRPFLAWPLESDGQVIGVLCISDKEHALALTTEDEQLMATVALRVATLLRRSGYALFGNR